MTDPQRMADHWWWRPGWNVGRRFYTWHIIPDGTEAHGLAETYRAALAPLPDLDLIPDDWLHLTMQGVGFVDEVADGEVQAIVDAAKMRLAELPAFDLRIDRPEVTPEAIRWEAEPTEPVMAVRNAVRSAIAEVWPQVPEPENGFRPHISIAYSSGTGPAAPVLDTIAKVPSTPATTRISSVELIVLHRDNRMYEWESYASVALG